MHYLQFKKKLYIYIIYIYIYIYIYKLKKNENFGIQGPSLPHVDPSLTIRVQLVEYERKIIKKKYINILARV